MGLYRQICTLMGSNVCLNHAKLSKLFIRNYQRMTQTNVFATQKNSRCGMLYLRVWKACCYGGKCCFLPFTLCQQSTIILFSKWKRKLNINYLHESKTESSVISQLLFILIIRTSRFMYLHRLLSSERSESKI